MKKIILLSVLALGAMTMSGQMTLINDFKEEVDLDPTPSITTSTYSSDYWHEFCGIYFDRAVLQSKYACTIVKDTNKVASYQLWDKTTGEIISSGKPSGNYNYVINGIFGDPDQIFLVNEYRTYYPLGEGPAGGSLDSVKVFTEQNQLMYSFNMARESGTNKRFAFYIYEVSGINYLLVNEETGDAYYGTFKRRSRFLYRLGNSPSSYSTPTSPSRTSSARKVVENGQMYIILDGVKYAVTGTEL